MEKTKEGLLLRQLEAAWRTGELVGFHKWSDDPSIFLVGFVRSVDENTAKFLTVDLCGRNEQDVEVPLSELEAISRGSAYLMGLTYLNGLSENIPQTNGRVSRAPQTRLQALHRALEAGTVVFLEFLSGDHYYFLVKDIDREFVVLETLVDGMPDGVFTKRIDQIDFVREGSDREIAEFVLYRASQGFEDENPLR